MVLKKRQPYKKNQSTRLLNVPGKSSFNLSSLHKFSCRELFSLLLLLLLFLALKWPRGVISTRARRRRFLFDLAKEFIKFRGWRGPRRLGINTGAEEKIPSAFYASLATRVPRQRRAAAATDDTFDSRALFFAALSLFFSFPLFLLPPFRIELKNARQFFLFLFQESF